MLLLIGITTSCTDEDTEDIPAPQKLYFPARHKGLWGYIDQTGKMVIKPKYQTAGEFNEGLAPVSVEVNRVRKWGFINKEGQLVIEPQFDYAFPFSEGLSAVSVDNKWGYVDRNGILVIEPQFLRSVGPFHGGRAYVWQGDKMGFIDQTGKIVIKPQFDYGDNFSEGLAKMRIGSCPTGGRGYIDDIGNWVIPPIFKAAGTLRNGVAFVRTFNDEFFHINRKGEILSFAELDHKNEDALPLCNFLYDIKYTSPSAEEMNNNRVILMARHSGGLFPVENNNLFGFADSLKNIIVEPQFYTVAPFCNGLSRVVFKDWKMGYIDQTGKVVYKEK